ncbi:hypothetical protein AX16_000347 [Volvariella volvacea WC 439]|nr:hypothetical protein AX16_000347 [Volvariella volvacea WC 439]
MKAIASLSLLVLARTLSVAGHGGHTGPQAGETIQQYAQRHMASEHHIDTFDIGSFFQLHDLNRDGVWDRAEIEAVYGVHHVYSQKKSKDEIAHQQKADHIVNTVLSRIDLNKDGRITLDELEKVGLDGLPNFDESLGAEGHHYDVESEFFLHHEEQFHNTPETQTDESYNHPEDIEHFAHHEEIELREAEREAQFQGITVEEALASHEHQDTPAEGASEAQAPINQQQQRPKITRVTPPEKQDPSIKYRDAASQNRDEWGLGEDGYKAPRGAADKLRKNLPYKYKFRRNWGDF